MRALAFWRVGGVRILHASCKCVDGVSNGDIMVAGLGDGRAPAQDAPSALRASQSGATPPPPPAPSRRRSPTPGFVFNFD